MHWNAAKQSDGVYNGAIGRTLLVPTDETHQCVFVRPYACGFKLLPHLIIPATLARTPETVGKTNPLNKCYKLWVTRHLHYLPHRGLFP